jgi:hypothetical protein
VTTRLVTHFLISGKTHRTRSFSSSIMSSAAAKGNTPVNGAAAEIPYELPW